MALIKCKECGKEISDKTKTCIHCGCPVNEVKNDTGIININYPKTYGMLIPNIEVYFKDSLMATVENESSTEICIDEDGILLFKGSFRKTEVEVKSDYNYEITLTWNRFTGQLVAKVDSWR